MYGRKKDLKTQAYYTSLSASGKSRGFLFANDVIFPVSKSRTKAVLTQEHSSLSSSSLITPRDPKLGLLSLEAWHAQRGTR